MRRTRGTVGGTGTGTGVRFDDQDVQDIDVRGGGYNHGLGSTAYAADRSKKMTETLPYYFDKRILITGSSSGVGRSLAFWFLNNGARVALVG